MSIACLLCQKRTQWSWRNGDGLSISNGVCNFDVSRSISWWPSHNLEVHPSQEDKVKRRQQLTGRLSLSFKVFSAQLVQSWLAALQSSSDIWKGRQVEFEGRTRALRQEENAQVVCIKVLGRAESNLRTGICLCPVGKAKREGGGWNRWGRSK